MMNSFVKFRVCAFFGVLSILPSVSVASNCPATFFNAQEPVTKQQVKTLCSEGCAVGFDESIKEPRWSAEHLTRESIMQAQALKGRAQFHEDIRIASSEQATLSDYKYSGWARGHMAPSGDMPTRSARMECFALTNIVPQDNKLNSGEWEHIEQQVRTEAKNSRGVYVVTGPAFLGGEHHFVGANKLMIPSHIWKAVYDVKNRSSWAVICKNQADSQCQKESVSELENEIGIRVFSDDTKS